jgi:hypothetical protein
MKYFGRINVPRKEKGGLKKRPVYLPQRYKENTTNNDSINPESGESVFLYNTNK